MTPGDAARVLAACALFDNRKVRDDEEGERLAEAWYAVIGDLDLRDALEAVRRHYRDSTEWIMPAHVRKGVAQIKAERRRNTPHEVRQLPSPFEKDVTREVTVARGAASVRAALEPLMAKLAQASDQPPEAIDQLRAITPGPAWSDDDTTEEKEGK